MAATVEDNETIRRRRDVVSSHIVKTTLARPDNRIDVGEKAFFRFDWKSFFVTHDPVYDEHRHCLGSRDGPPRVMGNTAEILTAQAWGADRG